MSNPYGHGIDNGAFYDPETGGLVRWEGLISVTPKLRHSNEFLQFDGEAIYQSAKNMTNQFTISAFTYPKEFEQYAGWSANSGIRYSGGQSELFNLIYRTVIGGRETYRIHWGVSVTPTNMDYTTITTTETPNVFSWDGTELSFDWLDSNIVFGHSLYFPNEQMSELLDKMVNGEESSSTQFSNPGAFGAFILAYS